VIWGKRPHRAGVNADVIGSSLRDAREILTAPDETWTHAEVRLRPANPEYRPLTPEAEGDVRPVAELVEVLR